LPRTDDKKAERFLVAVSFIADAAGLLAYLGLDATRSVRIGLGSALSVVALSAGGTTAVSAARSWLGPRGAYRTSGYHRNTFLAALACLALAALLIASTVHVVVTPEQKPSGHTPHTAWSSQASRFKRGWGHKGSYRAFPHSRTDIKAGGLGSAAKRTLRSRSG
jgi:hypothetical protein